MRIFPKFTLIIVLVLFHGCKHESKTHQRNAEETVILPNASEAFIKNFNKFFELFKTDSTFQKMNIKFPLELNLKNPRDESHRKNKQIYIEKSDFVFFDLHKFENDSNYETYKSVPSDEYAKFTIREIGTENFKIFSFITENNKWILKSCDDFSLSH